MVNYNRLERPVLNDSAPIVVELGFTLRQIIDVVSPHSFRFSCCSSRLYFSMAVKLYSYIWIKHSFKWDVCTVPKPTHTESFVTQYGHIHPSPSFFHITSLNQCSCGFASFFVTFHCVFCAMLTPFPNPSTYPVSYHLATLCLYTATHSQIIHPKNWSRHLFMSLSQTCHKMYVSSHHHHHIAESFRAGRSTNFTIFYWCFQVYYAHKKALFTFIYIY